MPYLIANRKAHLDSGGTMVTPGDLTYVLTKNCLDAERNDDWLYLPFSLLYACTLYMEDHQHPNFATRCEVIGAIRCAALEYRRRRQDDWIAAYDALMDTEQRFYHDVVAPYEDLKINQNGDVYT